MNHGGMDLCLGSEIGLRALRTVPAHMVKNIYSVSEKIRLAASDLGFNVPTYDLNHDRPTDAEFAVSVHYPVILGEATIERYRRVYNIHPGFLPWGRGWYPVFWALFRGEPAGATLHEIDVGLDTGPIVKQIEVPVRPEDDGKSLHERVTAVEGELFAFLIGELSSGRTPPAADQSSAQGSYHSKDEFFRWKRNPPLEELSSKEVLDLIRALSYQGYSGLEVDCGAQRFSVSMVPMDDEQSASTASQNGWPIPK